jgi:hypothetical protein
MNRRAKKEASPVRPKGLPLAFVMDGERVKRLTHKVIHTGCALFLASLQMKHLQGFLVVACERSERRNP